MKDLVRQEAKKTRQNKEMESQAEEKKILADIDTELDSIVKEK